MFGKLLNKLRGGSEIKEAQLPESDRDSLQRDLAPGEVGPQGKAESVTVDTIMNTMKVSNGWTLREWSEAVESDFGREILGEQFNLADRHQRDSAKEYGKSTTFREQYERALRGEPEPIPEPAKPAELSPLQREIEGFVEQRDVGDRTVQILGVDVSISSLMDRETLCYGEAAEFAESLYIFDEDQLERFTAEKLGSSSCGHGEQFVMKFDGEAVFTFHKGSSYSDDYGGAEDDFSFIVSVNPEAFAKLPFERDLD